MLNTGSCEVGIVHTFKYYTSNADQILIKLLPYN